MRGDHAPLPEIADLAEKYDAEFEEGILTVMDDSHGVGAVGETGRGTTELTNDNRLSKRNCPIIYIFQPYYCLRGKCSAENA
jgi:7-keto-8-aminopelargonate synthetase-like enzyme